MKKLSDQDLKKMLSSKFKGLSQNVKRYQNYAIASFMDLWHLDYLHFET